eukprot:8870326-Pyramimonas_sp.AAC.1
MGWWDDVMGWWDDVMGWWDDVTQVLEPAIELAESGFPVTPITAYHWDKVHFGEPRETRKAALGAISQSRSACLGRHAKRRSGRTPSAGTGEWRAARGEWRAAR